MNEAEIINALKKKFPAEQYALLPQVRNGTGFQRQARTADALFMSLWPSRGLDLEGIEIKVYRGDWLREMKDPKKAESIYAYCDRWWLVVSDADIVKDGELPSTWGLMVAGEKGIRVKVPAPKLDAKPLDRLMLAAMLRKAQEYTTDNAVLEKEKREAFDRGGKEMESVLQHRNRHLLDLQKEVVLFEQASGVQIRNAWNHGNIGKAVRMVIDGEFKNGRQRLEQLAESARRLVESAEKELAVMDSVCPKTNLPVGKSIQEGVGDVTTGA